jgi:glycerol-3-phosphate acyltransferase PlsY
VFNLDVIAVSLVGYLVGSIPFAVILAKRRGVDVYEVGSGNPGATNVTRHVGKGFGLLVFFLDFLKGLFATWWFRLEFFVIPPEDPIFLAMCGMVASVLGHSFPVYSRFRGGKGVATTMGALLVVFPEALAVGLLVWLVLFLWLRYVSLASIGFGASLPITVLFCEWFVFEAYEHPYLKVGFAAAIGVWILIRHHENVARLLTGEENKFSGEKKKKKKKESSTLNQSNE